MKTLKTFILLIAFVGLISCDDNKEISNVTVDKLSNY